MSQWEKLLARIHNNPKTVTFDELDKILQRAGYVRLNLGVDRATMYTPRELAF